MGIGLKVPERKIRWAIRQMQLVIAKLFLNSRPKMLMHCHKPQITSIQHILLAIWIHDGIKLEFLVIDVLLI